LNSLRNAPVPQRRNFTGLKAGSSRPTNASTRSWLDGQTPNTAKIPLIKEEKGTNDTMKRRRRPSSNTRRSRFNVNVERLLPDVIYHATGSDKSI